MRVRVCLLVVILAVVSLTPSLEAGIRAEQHAIAAARDIVIDGSRIRVRGDVHANGSTLLIGQVTIEGVVEGGRVVLTGESRAAGTAQGAPPTAIPGADFASLRARANRVLTGDQRLSGVVLLPGLTYVAGSVTLEGLVLGLGMLVAEGEVRLANVQSIGTPLMIIAGSRLVIDASRVSFRGLLQSSGSVVISGSGISVTGAVVGGDVQIRGSDITIAADPAVFSATTFPFPPITGPVLAPPAIIYPRQNALISDGSSTIVVSGTASPGAAVRLTLVNHGNGSQSVAEARADGAGGFQANMPLPGGLGVFTLTAVSVSGGLTSSAATVTFTAKDVRTPGGD